MQSPGIDQKIDDFARSSLTRFMKDGVMVAIIFTMIAAGCGTKAPRSGADSRGAPAGTNRIVMPAPMTAGTVMAVNKVSRFVVLGFPIAAVPPPGQRLNVYRKGLKVAELKVTGPQEEGNTVADILSGEVYINDEVRED